MAFVVGDIVRRTDGTQKYKVYEVLASSKYACKYEPNTAPQVTFTFKESELVKVS